MRVLITGAGGMLGQDLVAAATAAELEVVSRTRRELDIIDSKAVAAALSEISPDVVVNCAAWTDVDAAESEFASALAVNGAAAGALAGAVAAAGAWTIHISSDYVFDGAKREPYLESDATSPVSAYGRSKLAGEEEVAQGAPGAHTIVRSSWLFGRHGPCFPATILRLAAERRQLDVVDDQVGSPTFTGHLVQALVALAGDRRRGIVHVAGGGSCSWFQFARQIVERAGVDCQVRPVPTSQMPRPAHRPAFSVLGTERGAPELADWRAGLEEFLAQRVRV